MKTMKFAMTIDDVALDGWCKPETLKQLIEFLLKNEIPATFNIVPIDEASDKPFYTWNKEYLPIIKDAMQAGFDFQQHGLRHNRFEFGVPPAMVLDLPHEIENKRWAEANEEFLKKDHCVENCRKRLRHGRIILEDALGTKICGFRAPALQSSPGMFQALKEEGYWFDSTLCLQETGWDYILGRMDVQPREITPERIAAIKETSLGLTMPLTCDYTWMLPHERFDKTLAMAKHDFRQCMACGIPFIPLAHVDPIFEGDGIRFWLEFWNFMREEAAAYGMEMKFDTLKNTAISEGMSK